MITTVAIPSLGKIVLLAIVGIAAFLFFSRSQTVGPGRAAGEIGEGLGSIGGGVQQFLTGIGTGTAQLLNPAFSLVELARQGGSLFGFNSEGTRQTEQRPREIANSASVLTAPVSRGRTASISAGAARQAASRAAQRSGAAFGNAFQRGFAEIVEAGQLDQYRGYYRSLQEYLTPDQRRLL